MFFSPTNSSERDTFGLPLLINRDKCPGREISSAPSSCSRFVYINISSYFQVRIFSEILLTKNFRIFLLAFKLNWFTTNFTIFIITNGGLCVTPSLMVSFGFFGQVLTLIISKLYYRDFFFYLCCPDFFFFDIFRTLSNIKLRFNYRFFNHGYKALKTSNKWPI